MYQIRHLLKTIISDLLLEHVVFLMKYVVFYATFPLHENSYTTSAIWQRPWHGISGKPRRTKQSLKRLYKAPTNYTKIQKDHTKPQNTIQNRQENMQNPNILDKNQKY